MPLEEMAQHQVYPLVMVVQEHQILLVVHLLPMLVVEVVELRLDTMVELPELVEQVVVVRVLD
jgi:hypothetical protein